LCYAYNFTAMSTVRNPAMKHLS